MHMSDEESNYPSKVRLDLFNKKNGLDRGKNKFVEILWYLIKMIFFLSFFPWPNRLKVLILNLFGAKIGKDVVIQPNVNIHFPWKLEIGNNSWIGQGCLLLNFEKISIGNNVAIAHRIFICCGNHNFRDITYSYMNKPVKIKDGVVVGSNSFISPGVFIGTDSVITAGSIVTQSMPSNMICSGNPCKPIKQRWKNNDNQ